MNINKEVIKIATETSLLIEEATCMNCCEYFKNPTDSSCGHTLCRRCWVGRIMCPHCNNRVYYKELTPNPDKAVQVKTVKCLQNAFEKKHNIKIAELFLDEVPKGDFLKKETHFSAPPQCSKSSKVLIECSKDRVNNWLETSQNHFAEQPSSSQKSLQKKKLKQPEPRKVYVVRPVSQDDWDKIEPLPESEPEMEDANNNGKGNMVGPMDEVQIDNENQYTSKNTKNSKRYLKPREEKDTTNKIYRKRKFKDASKETDEESNKPKQSWNDFKRRRKEIRSKRVRTVTGSNLGIMGKEKLKRLCTRNKWTYVDKYSNELTHLVVKLDQGNKLMRSAEYWYSLAASKWIISEEWVDKCLQSSQQQLKSVNAEEFEVLDPTGEPSPMRSRLATKKLFEGFQFSLDFNLFNNILFLKELLESAGGTVVTNQEAVRVMDVTTTPALLLSEAHMQEDESYFLEFAEQSIVPVRYSWVFRCLARYRLASIRDLLLYPVSLLPKATENWPQELLK